MSSSRTLAIVSDIHYAGAAEQTRRGFLLAGIKHPLQRWLVRAYRHHIWLRDPFAHNQRLDTFLAQQPAVDFAVANGDYSCDSAFIGVSDDAACHSAAECLGKLRARFGSNLRANFGDHELGKASLGAGLGGLRLASFYRAQTELGLTPFWQITLGRYVLLGVLSSLVAFPVYEPEALPAERDEWQRLRERHLAEIRDAFGALQPGQRVILFCHDPTALPFLWREAAVRQRLDQVEQTVVGHLHSPLVLWQSRLLGGMPRINFLGTTARRLSAALREARHWRPFRLRLCPSLAGIQLLKDGGYYTVTLDLNAEQPAQWRFHPLPW